MEQRWPVRHGGRPARAALEGAPGPPTKAAGRHHGSPAAARAPVVTGRPDPRPDRREFATVGYATSPVGDPSVSGHLDLTLEFRPVGVVRPQG